MRELILCAAILIANLALVPQAASPNAGAPAGAPAATDQTKLALAKQLFAQLQSGTVDHALLDDSGNMSLDDDTVKDISTQVAPLGAPVTFVQQQVGTHDGNAAYTYLLTFKNGTKITLDILVDATGKIAGISVEPG
jgi:hypothetical protein